MRELLSSSGPFGEHFRLSYVSMGVPSRPNQRVNAGLIEYPLP